MRVARMAFCCLLITGAAIAQQYVISTLAGGAPPPTPMTALQASIGKPSSLITDSAGKVYFSNWNSVFRLDSNGNLTRIAGNGRSGFSGDGGPPTDAQLDGVSGLAVDTAGNIYIADTGNQCIRRVGLNGVITTVAGNGMVGYSGDQGPAIDAEFIEATSIAVDADGNLYIADWEAARIQMVSPAGLITTIAGLGSDAPDKDISILQGTSLAVGPGGDLYFTEPTRNRVRKISKAGVITTVAGGGHDGLGDGGPATSAELHWPLSLATDTAGNLYFSEWVNPRVRKVSTSGIITTVAGDGEPGYPVDGRQATSAHLGEILGLALDNSGNLFLADDINNRILRVFTDGVITAVAGDGTESYSGDGGPATKAQLQPASGVASDSAGNVYIADSGNTRIRKVAPDGTISTIAGGERSGYSGDGGPAIRATLSAPTSLTLDIGGNLYFVDNCRVRKISPSGTITTVAGKEECEYSGDGGPAVGAGLFPEGLAIDVAGNVYISDASNRVRKVTANGVINTVAGNGTSGYSGDGGSATSAQLAGPTGLAVDAAGNLFVADRQNSRVRKISTAGIITTVAGDGTTSYSPDTGYSTSTHVVGPTALAFDDSGDLFIADCGNNGVLKVSSSGMIATLAGNNTYGYTGDGGPATSAQFGCPSGIAVSHTGSIYVTDPDNNAVRRLEPGSVGFSLTTVTNAASGITGPLAPGEIVVIWGRSIGPEKLTQADPPAGHGFGTELAGTRVTVNGIAAPILYTSATQVAAVIPYGVRGSVDQVSVACGGHVTNTFSASVLSSSPGIFTADGTGTGQAAAMNQDNSPNEPDMPARTGEVIVLYATGGGQTIPAGADGILGIGPIPHLKSMVEVTIGGQPAQVLYAGGALGAIAGLMQINVVIPSSIQTGNAVAVVLKIGGIPSQSGVTIAVR